MDLQTLNSLLAVSTVAIEVLAVAFSALFFLEKSVPDLTDIGDFLGRYGLAFGFFLALGAAAVTLVHSFVFNLPPCDLCWWQRIFLYPQVVLLGIAALKKDARIAGYSLVLSILGAAVALYHHVLQLYPAGNLPCPSQGVSCTQILFLEFGYITYPMMSLSLFALLIALMLFVRSRRGS